MLCSKPKSWKGSSQCRKKLNLSIFFVKIYDFSFYNIQYIFLNFRKGAFRISAWAMEWGMHCHTFKHVGVLRIAFPEAYYKKLKKSNIFSRIVLYLFCHILRTTSSSLLIFYHILSLRSLALWHNHFASLTFTFTFKIKKNFLYLSKKWLKFFLRINATLWIITPTAELKVLYRSFEKFLMRCS